jgi:hypothetical protein
LSQVNSDRVRPSLFPPAEYEQEDQFAEAAADLYGRGMVLEASGLLGREQLFPDGEYERRLAHLLHVSPVAVDMIRGVTPRTPGQMDARNRFDAKKATGNPGNDSERNRLIRALIGAGMMKMHPKGVYYPGLENEFMTEEDENWLKTFYGSGSSDRNLIPRGFAKRTPNTKTVSSTEDK